MNNLRTIDSRKDTYSEYLENIWKSFHLIIPIIVKDFKVRYSQTFIGAFWSVLSPFLSVTLYFIFFGIVFKLPTEGDSYFLFVLTGFACWNILSQSCIQVGSALQQHQELIKKISAPKILLPIAKSIAVWMETSILIVLAIIISIFTTDIQAQKIAVLPFLLIEMFLFSTSVGLLISALTIQKKDILHGLPMILQLLIWFTPVFYPIQILPGILQNIIALNPFTCYIEIFRWTLGISPLISMESLIGIGLSLFIVIIAFIYFKLKEDFIVDYF